MNVKISYTIPFKEIPNEINKMLWKISQEFEAFRGKTEDAGSLGEEHILKKMQAIDEIRKKMLLLDLQLEDCYNIFASYNKTLADNYTPQITPESTQVHDIKSD